MSKAVGSIPCFWHESKEGRKNKGRKRVGNGMGREFVTLWITQDPVNLLETMPFLLRK
jgi:hypothetical protein